MKTSESKYLNCEEAMVVLADPTIPRKQKNRNDFLKRSVFKQITAVSCGVYRKIIKMFSQKANKENVNRSINSKFIQVNLKTIGLF